MTTGDGGIEPISIAIRVYGSRLSPDDNEMVRRGISPDRDVR
jgi:hypothetical protein